MKQMTQGCLKSDRGVILVETALNMLFILAMMFGAFQLSMLGYVQLSMDAGTFVQAHQEALYISHSDALNETQKVFRPMNSTDISLMNAQPAPMPSIAGVGFGPTSQTDRHGGMSLVLPTQESVTALSKPGTFQLLGNNITLKSLAIEPRYEEVCPHYCLSTIGISAQSTFGSRVSYFTGGEDSTPYFGGFAFMHTCDSSDIDPTRLSIPFQFDVCPAGDILWRGLGLAEHLDQTNYTHTNNGTAQVISSYLTPADGIFYEAWCHRRFYAAIALQVLNRWQVIPVTPTEQSVFLQAMFRPDVYPVIGSPAHFIYTMPGGSLDIRKYGWDATDLSIDPATSNYVPGPSNHVNGCDVY